MTSEIIVALDFDSSLKAMLFTRAYLDPGLCKLKIGYEVYSEEGMRTVDHFQQMGYQVFLDLKLHDIPTTVAAMCRKASEHGVWMLNVHTLGGREMLQAARQATQGPLLIGVTALTSVKSRDLFEVGLEEGPFKLTRQLVELADSCRLDGVVCSPMAASTVKRRYGKNLVTVTPSIRLDGQGKDDHAETLSPGLAHGCDYLVIGRPITRAEDPKQALEQVYRSIHCV